MGKRNNTIDLLKLMFSLIIVIYHISINLDGFSLFQRGLLAVDFFFIVSGTFLVMSIEKQDTKHSDCIYSDDLKFILKKYRYFFPFIFIGFIICLLFRVFIDKIKIHTILNSVFSLFLLQMSGLPMSKVNNQTWYLSVMLISMFILYPIIKKKSQKYLNYYSPILIVIGFGIFNKIFKNFNGFTDYNIVYNGFLRGFLEINLGCFIYNIQCKIRKLKFTKFSKILFTIMETLGYSFIIFMMNINNTKLDMFIVLVFVNSILISFTNISYLNNLVRKLKLKNIDKLSLSIYCNHIAVICVMTHFNKYTHLSTNELAILIFCITILFSAIVAILIRKVNSRIRFKNLLIQDCKESNLYKLKRKRIS